MDEKDKNSKLNIVYLDVPEVNKLNLTAKTISTILYANENEEFDWFLKADGKIFQQILTETFSFIYSNLTIKMILM